MTFTSLQFEDISHEKPGWLRLTQSLNFSHGGFSAVVPRGFETDLASIPPIFAAFGFTKLGRYDKAAVVHDYLYRQIAATEKDPLQQTMSRFLADAIFREAMMTLGVAPWKRILMFYAVRACGWYAIRQIRRGQ